MFLKAIDVIYHIAWIQANLEGRKNMLQNLTLIHNKNSQQAGNIL